ncbi:MAG: hypothetical protein M0Q53_10280 [Prolixibacteraceae bacterium]|jgi:hypothetical protein|nr:hypothetical protein [Prolixibacteraceae bacterium]
MEKNYNIEWFDLLVTITLNPGKTDFLSMEEDQINTVITQIAIEKEQFKSLLKNQVFGLTKESQIELLIKKYHSALIFLLDEAFANKEKLPEKNELIAKTYDNLISCLDELLSFIEVRFSSYLSLDERVPATYLIVTKKELSQRLGKLKTRLYKLVPDRRIVDIVLNTLYSFTNRPQGGYLVTFRDVLYKKELTKELEVLEDPEKETCIYTALNELLIYLNFNSKAFANHFTERLAEKINGLENLSEKQDQLLVHFKDFNQMHRKPGVIFNPQYRDLKTVLSNWFVQEIFYLEKKMRLSVTPLQGNTELPKPKVFSEKPKQKVMCILSTDQTGLILRASDELRILVAKSMSEVFKTIVPHLSTPYKEELSYDGMRSKSYVAEERDKQIAIETLERIIRKIKEY